MRNFTLFALCLTTILLLSLPSHAQGSKTGVPPVPKADLEKVNPEPFGAEELAKAQAIYGRKCAGCHNLSGDGQGPVSKKMGFNATAFNDAEGMQHMTDGELFYWLTKGRDPMPTFERKLTESDRWLLVHFLRTLAEKVEKPLTQPQTQTQTQR